MPFSLNDYGNVLVSIQFSSRERGGGSSNERKFEREGEKERKTAGG
jgi:hypothetical protein